MPDWCSPNRSAELTAVDREEVRTVRIRILDRIVQDVGRQSHERLPRIRRLGGGEARDPTLWPRPSVPAFLMLRNPSAAGGTCCFGGDPCALLRFLPRCCFRSRPPCR